MTASGRSVATVASARAAAGRELDNGRTGSRRPGSNNLNPVGRLHYAGCTLDFIPNSLAGHGPGLGAQEGENRIRQVAEQAGFRRFRRATQTPFNAMHEAR
jgi:hypothetical protein